MNIHIRNIRQLLSGNNVSSMLIILILVMLLCVPQNFKCCCSILSWFFRKVQSTPVMMSIIITFKLHKPSVHWQKKIPAHLLYFILQNNICILNIALYGQVPVDWAGISESPFLNFCRPSGHTCCIIYYLNDGFLSINDINNPTVFLYYYKTIILD